MFMPNVIANLAAYLLAIAAGSLLTALILGLLKKELPETA